MSNTLDRLKALSNKLEDKLTEKVTIGSDEPKNLHAQEDKKPENSTKDDAQKSDGDYKKLAQNIISHMGIDESSETARVQNLMKVAQLYLKLNIDDKAPDFNNIFIYKAMNISGIGLKEDDFGEIRAGKYCQIIAITYEPDKNGKKKAKNISLSYFGKAEKLEDGEKNDIMEFVLRWRYEKAFQNLEHYKELIEKIRGKDTLF